MYGDEAALTKTQGNESDAVCVSSETRLLKVKALASYRTRRKRERACPIRAT